MSNAATSGVNGIDKILYGGLPRGSSIIVEGSPGTGKTTLGVQFLYHGAVECGEPGIYITFEEFPQQIYQDMRAFGWDLRELEKRNLLRVVSIKPDLLLKQMKTPDGLFEQMIREIDCQRIVVDSISLFQYMNKNPEEIREVLYILKNIFRKHNLTALLISEHRKSIDDQISFEHYVVDGVIHLSLEEQMTKYRKRTLEITKMRGRKFVEGEHIYRITERGIHLIPALSIVDDAIVASPNQMTTGIDRLDKLLSGGIPKGSSIILDTNSKANYSFLVASIVSERIKQGDRVLAMPSSLNGIADTQRLYRLFDVDLEQICRQKGMYFIEHMDREIPPGFEEAVLDAKNLSNEQYLSYLKEKVLPVIQEGVENGENWFLYYDLNTKFSVRGADFVRRFFAEETAWARSAGVTVFALCNFAEITGESASYLERTSNCIMRTWVDGNYQYLQITKSPSGKVSEPYLVELIPEKPYIQLV
ncbi:circadian clock protein KaiC [Cohnella pontilimi]|uniref:Circadian clock protein KaiC n=1 Tax=Cohnella pontilimi TaxID=2564100 RepID=A0A4U0FAZ2_9BACL|nr:ATPase domain-containing protein [Cohnella pontilimi]TJY41935.1 circadian clock protein KaiC [Cohnella pontilimi]